MSRRRPTPATALPPLAHDGRLAQLAAERFPAANARVSQSDRAAYWVGEYVKALRDLPHLKPSELLALIAEQDDKACGATFTRTIKRLAQPHLDDRTKATSSPTPAPRRKMPVTEHPTSPPPPVNPAAAVPPPTPPSRRDDDDSAADPDLLARMQSMQATPPRKHEA